MKSFLVTFHVFSFFLIDKTCYYKTNIPLNVILFGVENAWIHNSTLK